MSILNMIEVKKINVINLYQNLLKILKKDIILFVNLIFMIFFSYQTKKINIIIKNYNII